MKRRAFFRGMFGAAAAPLAIKAAEAMESLPELPPVAEHPKPMQVHKWDVYCTGVAPAGIWECSTATSYVDVTFSEQGHMPFNMNDRD